MSAKQTIIDSMKRNAKENGYYLCPDAQLFSDLIDGLATNISRYGYGSCPCRVASGLKKYDVDIICPCEYRDADVDEFGMCYCGLFVQNLTHLKNQRFTPNQEKESKPSPYGDVLYADTSAHENCRHQSVLFVKQKRSDSNNSLWIKRSDHETNSRIFFMISSFCDTSNS